MNDFWDSLRELLRYNVSTNPLETAIFLFVIFGFFGILIIAYHINKKKERKRLARVREENWQRLCNKYGLSDGEKSFLEKLAEHLEMPEKKYLLLANYNTFQQALEEYSKRERPEAGVVASIIKKTGMKKAKEVITEMPVQRRKSARIPVNITALIAPIEENTADIKTRMLDLSKGGCRTINPKGRFSAGDDIKITFIYKDKKYTDIPASVVRTSGKKKILHLSFGHVRKKDRAH